MLVNNGSINNEFLYETTLLLNIDILKQSIIEQCVVYLQN